MRSSLDGKIHRHLHYIAICVTLLFLIIPALIIPSIIYAQSLPERPSPPRLVNDYSSTLKPEEMEALEQKLAAFNNETSTQIAVVILETLEGYPIADYAVRLGEKWGVGQKDKNNGAVILVALQDREVFVATGYGLEGVIPDALAKRIVESDIKPYFREGRYYEGLDRAADSMIALAKGEYTADKQGKPGESAYFPFPWFTIIFLVFFFFLLFRGRKARTIAANNNVPIWMALLLANMGSRHQRGKWDDFSSGSGDFSGGGGFGGFGGGGFGGGGAGGKW
ncbi:MAG: TPM domain-containing protein [Nitrospirae bacterium]|nr:TPM domain-containing protein [Nitrospirota bacterium]